MIPFFIFLVIITTIVNIIYFLSRRLSPIPYFPTNKKDLSLIVATLLSNSLLDKNKSSNQIQDTSNIIIDLGAGTGTVIFPAALEAYKREVLPLKIAGGPTPRRFAPGAIAGGDAVPFRSFSEGGREGQALIKIETSQKITTQFYAVEIHPLLIFIMHLKHLFHPNRKNIHILRTNLFNLNFSNLTIKQFNNITIYLYVGPFVMQRLKPVLQSFPKGIRIVSYMYEIPGWEKYLKEVRTGEKKLYCYELKKSKK
jgi:hypothetical protein